MVKINYAELRDQTKAQVIEDQWASGGGYFLLIKLPPLNHIDHEDWECPDELLCVVSE